MGVYSLHDTNEPTVGVLEDRTNHSLDWEPNESYLKAKERMREFHRQKEVTQRADEYDSHNPAAAQRRAAERATLRLKEEKRKEAERKRRPNAKNSSKTGRPKSDPVFRRSDGELRDVAEQEYHSDINKSWKKSIFLQDEWSVPKDNKATSLSMSTIQPFDPLDLPSLSEGLPLSPRDTFNIAPPPLPPPYDPFSDEAPPAEAFSPVDHGFRWERDRNDLVAKEAEVIDTTIYSTHTSMAFASSIRAGGSPERDGNTSRAPLSPTASWLSSAAVSRSTTPSPSPPKPPSTVVRMASVSIAKDATGFNMMDSMYNSQVSNTPGGRTHTSLLDESSPRSIKSSPRSEQRGSHPISIVKAATASTFSLVSESTSTTTTSTTTSKENDKEDRLYAAPNSPTKHQRTVRIGGARMLSLPKPHYGTGHFSSDSDSSASSSTTTSPDSSPFRPSNNTTINTSLVRQQQHHVHRSTPAKTLDVVQQQRICNSTTPLLLTGPHTSATPSPAMGRKSRQELLTEHKMSTARQRSRSEPTTPTPVLTEIQLREEREKGFSTDWQVTAVPPTSFRTKTGLVQSYAPAAHHQPQPQSQPAPRRRSKSPLDAVTSKPLSSAKLPPAPPATTRSNATDTSRVSSKGTAAVVSKPFDYDKAFAQVMKIENPERREKKLKELHDKLEEQDNMEREEVGGIPKNRVTGGAKYTKVGSRVTAQPKDRTREGTIKNIYARYQKIAAKSARPEYIQ